MRKKTTQQYLEFSWLSKRPPYPDHLSTQLTRLINVPLCRGGCDVTEKGTSRPGMNVPLVGSARAAAPHDAQFLLELGPCVHPLQPRFHVFLPHRHKAPQFWSAGTAAKAP